MAAIGTHESAHPLNSKRNQILLWILLILAATEFVTRGPVRYLHHGNWDDLAQYYSSSRTWLRGENFADPNKFVAMWRDEVGSTLDPKTVRVHISPPPGALVIFAPIAALPWPVAKAVWLFVLLASFAVTVWSLMKVARFSVHESRGIAFIAACLALAPFHTGIASANQTIFVVGCCAAGIWAADRKSDVWAGVLFGLACSLKPHIAVFLVLYYLLRGRWRLFGTAVALTVLLVAIAAAWMQFAGVHWLPDYLNNLRFAAAKNRVDDFTTANAIRFTLINLQVPFYSFTHGARSANLMAFSVGTALIVAWGVLVFRTRAENFELLALAAIAVIGLLPLYHRFYDASILAIPLCWCLSRPEHQRRMANVALVVMLPFLVPGATVLQEEARLGRIPEFVTHSWWWDRVLMPHQTWFLLLLSLVLLFGMTREIQAQQRKTASSG